MGRVSLTGVLLALAFSGPPAGVAIWSISRTVSEMSDPCTRWDGGGSHQVFQLQRRGDALPAPALPTRVLRPALKKTHRNTEAVIHRGDTHRAKMPGFDVLADEAEPIGQAGQGGVGADAALFAARQDPLQVFHAVGGLFQ